uniref:Beta-1,4-galactosyltransferase 7 n=1 Tax=Globodera pallida TaxID=36090 RepID=A0A183BLY4_GLOPA
MTILAIVLFTLLVITVLGLMLSELNNIADFVQQHQKHRLCVTIPYRDRWKELQEMLPLLHKFLSSQGIKAMYIIVNQSDIFRFNRASLVNIGALEAERVGCDYMAIHDVDIVPLNVNLSYHYPEGHIMHTAAGKYHPIKRYDYKNFIGSVLIITLADFKKVNGMSNDFWGWGLEDDDFYLRLKEAGMADRIRRPSNLGSNRTNTFLHLHERGRRRDYSLDEYRKKRKRKRDKSSGLLNLNYTLKACRTLKIRDIGVSMLDVNLFCDPTFASHCYAVP